MRFQFTKTKRIFNANVLSIAFVSDSNKENIFQVIKAALEGNLLAKVIFYFLPEVIPNISLENFSDWLSEERILYSLMVADDRVFTYNPYPEIRLVEVTSIGSVESVFTAKLADFHGAAIRVVRSIELSRDIEYVDRNYHVILSMLIGMGTSNLEGAL